MEAAEVQPKSWTSAQAYSFAIICLLVGAIAGYLLRTPRTANVVTPAVQRPGAEQVQVTPEQLRHMADKKVEPLLVALKDNPNDPAVLADVGKKYLYARQFQTAIEYYERSAASKPDANVLTTLGGAYHFAGQDVNAIGAWERALRVDPNHADALFNLAIVKWQAHADAKGAIVTLNQLLKTNPNHPKRSDVEKLLTQLKRHADSTANGKTDRPAM